MSIITKFIGIFRGKLNKLKRPSVPSTLDEALDRLVANSTPYDLEKYKASPEEEAGAYCHFYGGMAMRNGWKFWQKEGPLNEWFRANGIWHGDDKSGIIFKALWYRLNNIPFDIKREARYYYLYWAISAGLDFDGKPLTLSQDDFNSLKEEFEKEEARRHSCKSKRIRISRRWDIHVIDKPVKLAT